MSVLQDHLLQRLLYTLGQKARYCQNGIWKTTGRVRQIIEQTEDYVKFETDSVRYCIDHYGREANVLALVA